MNNKPFIVTTGLTRRLIYAIDVESALHSFLSLIVGNPDRKSMSRTITLEEGEVEIHEATDDEVADFARPKRVAHFDGQEKWDMNA